MKPTTTIAAIVLAATASTSLSAFAATATEPPKVSDGQAANATATKVQPHSHLQEKTGMAPQKKAAATKREDDKGDIPTAKDNRSGVVTQPKAPVAKTSKAKAASDKSRHFHPRDGK